MPRLLVALLLFAPLAVPAADDLKVSQLEQDVRNLQRQVQSQAQQIEELGRRVPRDDQLRTRPAVPAVPPAPSAQWIDASKWQRVRVGMSELAVIGLLGAPTSMRVVDRDRVLLYAIEIGNGFLGGSVTLRDRVVASVAMPVLK